MINLYDKIKNMLLRNQIEFYLEWKIIIDTNIFLILKYFSNSLLNLKKKKYYILIRNL